MVLTSLGVAIGIGSSTTENARPTSWTRIPQVIEMSDVDLDPDTIDTTSLDNKKYKSSVPGLIDTTGIQYLTVNATHDEKAETLWDSMAEATNAYVLFLTIKKKLLLFRFLLARIYFVALAVARKEILLH